MTTPRSFSTLSNCSCTLPTHGDRITTGAQYLARDATHPLQEVDVKRAKDALKNDPFFMAHKPWVKAIEQMLKMGVRAEQQALAKWGLNFVIEDYLPRKLANRKGFLP